jgi:hypothetical protein
MPLFPPAQDLCLLVTLVMPDHIERHPCQLRLGHPDQWSGMDALRKYLLRFMNAWAVITAINSASATSSALRDRGGVGPGLEIGKS